jgi:5-methylcytosine-specific restriction endonuclease McrA
MEAVLFLDQAYRPLRIENWQRAISDLFLGKVEVVEHSRDRLIQGVNRTYPMPAVVRVLRSFKRDRIRIKFSRLNVYARDGFACQYCGQTAKTEDLTFDHVLPRSRGGLTTWTNIATCCFECNMEKGDRTPGEAGMPLLRAPKKPAHLPSVQVRGMGDRPMPPEWLAYWSVGLQP